MNQDINQVVQQIIQEILQGDPNYFLPKQLHVLSWKSKKIENALITKINGQRYLGLLKKDKIGQDYWSYKLLSTSETSPQLKESVQTPPAETVSVGEPKQNSNAFSQKEIAESEAVKKFREKYGEYSVEKKHETPN